MADQLSRPVLATQGRRRLQSLLRPRTLLQALLPPTMLGEVLRGIFGVWKRFALLPPTMLGEGWDGGRRYSRRPSPSLFVILACALSLPLATQADNIVGKGVAPPKHKWTEFVQVKGQPEPVPAEWVSTPEGQFAHSIEIPNPVPKDSGYRWWWSAKKYFLHLCEKEAGEFVFKTAEDVEGFLFMRPPSEPSDFDLRDQYKLEAPGHERTFQGLGQDIQARGTLFVSPGRQYQYFEEPTKAKTTTVFQVASAYDRSKIRLSRLEVNAASRSRYAVTWRGLRRLGDREKAIAGSEVLVIDLRTNDVMAVWRDYVLTGEIAGGKKDVWWLTAATCPRNRQKYGRPELQQLYGFVSTVLVPVPLKEVQN